jgi:hypothetical protein
MIKLKSILREFDFGNALFARGVVSVGGQYSSDVPYSDMTHAEKYPAFLSKLKSAYGKDFNEPNTDPEKAFLKWLFKFLDQGGGMLSDTEVNSSRVKELLSLKSRFPLILDPTEMDSPPTHVWRGGSLPNKKVAELMRQTNNFGLGISNANGWENKDNYGSIEDPQGQFGLRNTPKVATYNKPIEIPSRALSSKGAASFSAKEKTGEQFFALRVGKGIERQNRVNRATGQRKPVLEGETGVLLRVPIDSENLIFNPDFLNLFTKHENEFETWYVGDIIKCDGIKIDTTFLKDMYWVNKKRRND